ncbi:hypothetical protein ACWT_3368 [Actinoplanes sp. SE50]|uniref:conjugal transfer protein TrbL family protein n=1 Tax=unclassified Actinoplanes TaxID=2626549 RepID=UPI00023ED07D|nr:MULTISPECIES: conjugal transfer protein TrbL family protein [unclassified Actinoplanes]AEV84391.1 hypothetical protein ACPL_3496 [Actinoplanes sp. SE50/110]ATO82783.1 hypothetical protein ACWT_3368 [Actinoplanes sp. SE50]SLM00191.1 hypothetical protein ACSP50_3423 [Actinoplanes sp. SE50/110]
MSVGWALSGVLGPLLGALSALVLAGLALTWRLLSTTVLVVPDVTALPQVDTLMTTSLGVVDTCYVLAFVWVGVLVMNREWLQQQSGLGEMIPRLVVGLVAANSARPICTAVVDTANALTTALAGGRGASPVPQLQAAVFEATNGMTGSSPEDFLILIIGAGVAVLALMLVVQWVSRAGLLILLAGTAPIALAMHATVQTEPVAKLWWRAMLAAPATVVLQAVALHTTLQVMLAPQTVIPALGLTGKPGAAMNLLVVVCLLWGTLRIPGLIGKFVLRSAPSRIPGVLRFAVLQQITGLARVRMGKTRTMPPFGGGHGRGRR